MNNREAVNWLINISADIGKAEHSDLWHYEQALTEIKDMLESAQPVATDANVGSSSEIPNTSDCISRQKAIDALKNSSLPYVWQGAEIIQNLPTIQPEERTEERTEMHACDLISRSEAIDALDKQIKQCCKALGSLSLSDADKHAVEVEMASFRAYREMLENLPTVQPERKKGEWLPDNNYAYEMRFVCSCCKESEVVPTIGFTKYKPIWDFCPNCGAKMRGKTK